MRFVAGSIQPLLETVGRCKMTLLSAATKFRKEYVEISFYFEILLHLL